VPSTADPVAVMSARGHKNPNGRLVQLTDYVLDKQACVPFLLAAEYGAGRVVGIGSWKMFINDLVNNNQNNNLKLFVNLTKWLSAE